MAEAKETAARPRTDDVTFRRVCEEVAASDTPTIAAIAERLGLKPNSVVQRRAAFNAEYKEHGIQLTKLPRGGGARKNVGDLAAQMKAEIEAAS